MVIYTYRKVSLFFHLWLLSLCELIDGLVGFFTFGLVRLGLDYNVFMALSVKELRLRAENMAIRTGNPWPRIQIWPRRKKS